MTTPKRAPGPSLAADDVDRHQEKRPRVEDQFSPEVADCETEQAIRNNREQVENTLTAHDKAIADIKEAHPSLVPVSALPSTTPQEASPSIDDAPLLSSKTPPSNVQATFKLEEDQPVVAKTARRNGRSPSPSGDVRIPLFQNETRPFRGEIIITTRKYGRAKKIAREAQRAPLMVDGRPQFNIFVDGSYLSLTKGKGEKRDTFSRGGYGVAFRNPYHGQGDSEYDHGQHGEETWGNDKTHPELSAKEDRLGRNEFNVRSWRSHRVYSSRHAELAAVSQGLETVIAVAKRQKPSFGMSVSIFSDSKDVINRIARPPIPDTEEMTDADAMSMPLVRAIVWQSHYLADEWNCKIKLRWLPRCCVLAHKPADHVAGWWRGADRHDASGDGTGRVFQQKDRPVWRRDGILDTLHDDLSKVLGRIERGEIRHPPCPPARIARPKRRDNGDMLDRFAGSAVQARMRMSSTDSLLQMPPIWDRNNAAYGMVDEDMRKISKGGRFSYE